MTAEEIKEYNTLCAEFLGWEYHKDHFINPLGGTPLVLKSDELLFYEDWNWIMSVLDKIESLELISVEFYVNNEYKSEYAMYQCFMYDCYEEIVHVFSNDKTQAYAEAIYKFLNWYKTK